MVRRMRASGGRCRRGKVPNCYYARLVFRPDPQNPPQTDEELQSATRRINEILESLTSPPGDPDRVTLVFLVEADEESDLELLRVAWVDFQTEEEDLTEIEQS
jgi:hypothetical protein